MVKVFPSFYKNLFASMESIWLGFLSTFSIRLFYSGSKLSFLSLIFPSFCLFLLFLRPMSFEASCFFYFAYITLFKILFGFILSMCLNQLSCFFTIFELIFYCWAISLISLFVIWSHFVFSTISFKYSIFTAFIFFLYSAEYRHE